MAKRYGLILPGSKPSQNEKPKQISKPLIFCEDSDSDEEKLPQMKSRSSPTAPGLSSRRQARVIQQKALEEDPTIFQYDELYDEMEKTRNEQKEKVKSESRKPKYIGGLLASAERRRVENERRIERMVLKERELEGDQFKDKESYVTPAYRKKLEELRKAEEQEKRESYLETIGDVTKQSDLSGFYRHLYEQKLGPKDIKEKDTTTEKSTEAESCEVIEDDSGTAETKQKDSDSSKVKTNLKSRTYRRRRLSEEDNDNREDEKNSLSSPAKKVHLQSNLDADSDFSIDSSSTDEENEDKENSRKNLSPEEAKNNSNSEILESKEEQINISKTETEINVVNEVKIKTEDEIKKEKDESLPVKEPSTDSKTIKEKKIKKDIWKKRTVGEVLEAALQRYYERKAARTG